MNGSMAPDEELIGAVLAGDRDGYAKLVDRYAGYTHALAYGYLKDTQTAEDIAQEAFVKAFTALRTLAAPKAFGAWLAQITRNLCRASLRRKQPATASLSAAESLPQPGPTEVEAHTAERHVREVLNEALDKLPPRLREVVSLFYLQGQSLHETAGFLGVSENTVKQRLHRARACLREHLDETLKEELPKLRPSRRFTNAVMAVLPLQPFDIGWATKGLGKLVSWFMLTPWLGPIVIVLLVNKATQMLMLSDVSDRYRPEFKKSLRGVTLIGLTTTGLGVAVGMFILDYPWLGLVFFLLPGLPLLFSMRKSLTLVSLNWRSLLLPVSFAAMVILFCAHMYYPYRGDFELGYDVAILALMCTFLLHLDWALHPKSPDEASGPTPQPVSMQFLRYHAVPFARVLNTPFHWIVDFHVEPDCIRYVSGIPRTVSWFVAAMAFKRPPRLDIELRLFPDGHVEIRLPNRQWPPGSPAPLMSVEEYEARTAEFITHKWAFYQAGDLKKARSAALNVPIAMCPSDFFKSRKGFRWVRYFLIAGIVLAAIFEGRYFYSKYITTPTLTASRLRDFYQGEFLDLYRKGFPEKPSDGPNDVPESRMVLYYSQPPSMMSIPGVAEAYTDLQKREFDRSGDRNIRFRARELVHGLEAGYLTIPMLQSWGLTREALTPKGGPRPEWATLDAKILSGETKPERFKMQSEMESILLRARLLKVMGLLDLMDPAIPDEIIKRLSCRQGVFTTTDEVWEGSEEPWTAFETTCLAACILNTFDRWDLADRQAVRRQVVRWPRRRHYMLDAYDIYLLGQAVVAVGAEDDLPLTRMAVFNRPAIFSGSRSSSWSISPGDINGFAVNDILSQRALLELR